MADADDDRDDEEQEEHDEDGEEEEEEEVYEMVEVDEDDDEAADEEADEPHPAPSTSSRQPSAPPTASKPPPPKPPQPHDDDDNDEAEEFDNVPITRQPAAAEPQQPAAQPHPSIATDPLAALANMKLDEAAAQVQGMAWEQLSKLGAAFATAATPAGVPFEAGAPPSHDASRSAAPAAGAATAGAGLAGFAKDITSWWSSLDKPPEQQGQDAALPAAKSPGAGEEVQQLFGLSVTENLVEQFKCKLAQTYACNHNTFTPAIKMTFAGTLSITDRHTCFSIEERGRKLPFKVAHGDVAACVYDAAATALRLSMAAGVTVEFKDFANPRDLESALALIEHLVESCKSGA